MQIASVEIGTSLDLSGFYSGMQDLERFNKLQKQKFDFKVNVDDERLFDLNKHFALKSKDYKKLQREFDQNPLTISVNTDELKREIAEVYAGLQSLNRNVTTRINVQSTLTETESTKTISGDRTEQSNRAVTEKLDSVIDKLDQIGDRIVDAVENSTKEGFFSKLTALPRAIIGNIQEGFFENFGGAFSRQLAEGMADYVEKKTGTSFFDAGRSAARFGYNRGKGFAEVGAQAAGYRGGLKEVGKDVEYLTQAFDDFLNPRKFVNKLQAFEDMLVGALEDVNVYNRPEAARERVAAFFKPDLETAREASARAAGVGVRAGAQPFRIQKRVKLAQSMELARSLSEQIQVPDIENIEDIETIALIAGGVNMEEGAPNTYFARNALKGVLGAKTASVPVPNVYSNSQEFGGIYKMRTELTKLIAQAQGQELPDNALKAMPIDRLMNLATETGYNPDSIKLEATRLAYEKKYPGKKFVFAGTSAGTVAAEEATAIAERGGAENVKGFGATLGLYGLTQTAKEFKAFVGELDPLFMASFGTKGVDTSKLSPAQLKIFEATAKELPPLAAALQGMLAPSKNTVVVPGAGAAHHLGQFMADETVQAELMKFLGGSAEDVPEELRGKSGTAAFKAYADMFGQFEALSRTFRVLAGDAEALNELDQGKYAFVTPDKQLRKTYGESQEKPDLEYAAAEFQVSKRVKGVAGKEGAEFQSIMQGLVDTLKDAETIDEDKITDLLNKFYGIFGVSPRFDESAIPFSPNQFAELEKTSKPYSEYFTEQGEIPKTPIRTYPAPAKPPAPLPLPKLEQPLEMVEVVVPPPVIEPPALTESMTSDIVIAEKAGQGILQRLGEGALEVGKSIGEAIGDTASNILVNRINNLLKQVPGQPGTIDISAPQIAKLSDITPDIAARLSELGTTDALSALGAARNVAGNVLKTTGGIAAGATRAIGGAASNQFAARAIESNRARLAKLRESAMSAQGLIGGRPDQSQYLIEAGLDKLPELLGEIDQAIALLPSADRTQTLPGNQLAQLKGQVRQLEQKFGLIQRKLQPQLEGNIGNLPALPASAPQVQPKSVYMSQIRALGEQFSGQYAGIKNAKALAQKLGEPVSQQSAQIAKEIVESADDAYQAIEDLVTSMGEGATDDIRNLAAAAKQKITKAKGKSAAFVSDAESAGVNVASGFNQGLAQSIGAVEQSSAALANESIDAIKKAFGIASPAKRLIPVGENVVAGLKVGIGNAVEGMNQFLSSSVADASQAALKRAIEDFGKVSNFRQDSMLPKATALAVKRASEMQLPEIPDLDAIESSIVAIGGFAGKGGKTSEAVGSRLQTMLGDSFNVDAVANVATDTSVDFSQKFKFARDVIVRMVTTELLRGFNPDAVEAAAVAIARSKLTNKPVDFVGYSAGGFVARQAQRIAENAGVQTKAAAVGTPMIGSLKADPERFKAFLGETDLIGSLPSILGRRSSPSQVMLKNAGYQHGLHNYLGHEEFQSQFYGFLGKGRMRPETANPALYPSAGLQPFAAKPDLGNAIGDGLVKGLNAAEPGAVAAAKDLAEAVIEATESELGIASPSRRFIEIGQNIAAGLGKGISEGFAAAKEKASELASGAVEGAKGAIGSVGNLPPIKALNEKSQNALFTPFEVTAERPEASIPIIGGPLSFMLDSMESMQQMVTFAPKVARFLGSLADGLMKNTKLLKLMGIGFGIFKIFEFIGPSIADFTAQSIEAALAYERFNRVLTFTEGSGARAADRLGEIREQSRALGTDLRSAIEGYTQLAAAARETPLEGAGAESLADALETAGSAYGLSAEEQQRVYTASSQIISKGTVSSEEIRGQLGEVLPGAYQIAARSQGMTGSQFGKQLELGNIQSADFIPKFAQQLEAELSVAASSAADSTQASINRMNSSFEDLKATVGAGILPGQKLGFELAAQGAEMLKGILPGLLTLMTALSLQGAATGAIIAKDLFLILMKGESVASVFSGGMTGIKNSIKAIGQATVGNNLGTWLLVVLAATEAMKLFGKVTEDGGGTIRTFADSASEGFEKYKTLIGESTEATERFGQSLRDIKAPSNLEDMLAGQALKTVFGQELGAGIARTTERSLQGNGIGGFLAQINPGAFIGARINEMRGGSGLATRAEQMANDQSIALGDSMETINEVQSRAMSMLGVDGKGVGDLARMNEIDEQLKQIQAQRQSLRPDDDEGRRQLQQQEQSLQASRESAAANVAALQAQLASYDAGLKDAETALQETIDRGGLSEEQLQQKQMELAQVRSAIAANEKLQSQFTRAINTSADAVRKLEKEFRAISNRLTDANSLAQLQASQAQLATSQAQLMGELTPGEAQFQGAINAQDNLAARIRNNTTAMAELNAKLQSSQVQQAMQTAGIDPSMGLAGMQERAGEVTEGQENSDFARTLTEGIKAYEQVQQLQLETTDLQAQMADSQVQAKESLTQSARQVSDFFRQITRSTEEILAAIESADLNTEIQSAKTALQSKLSPFTGRFFNDFVSGFGELIDLIFAPLQNALDMRSQIAQINNQRADQALQLGDMQRNLYGGSGTGATGATTPFEGITVTSAVDASGEPGLDYVVSDGRRGANFGALAGGEVIRTVTDQNWENNMGRGGPSTGRRGYGNQVIVRARDEVTGEFVDMLYAHLDSVAVQVGQQVGVGTVLGTQGRTGSTTGAHVSLDFFAPDSRETNSAALAMRDRYARELANGASNLNAQVTAPQPVAAPVPTNLGNVGNAATSASQYRPRGGSLSQAERVQSDPGGAAAMIGTAQRLGLDPNQFAALMSWESGGSFNPNVRGGDGGQYQGLIQFSPDNQQRYGIRPNQSIAEQMPAIERYLIDRGFRPGEHDIRHAYSAVLAGQADERYWDRSDSNGTTVRNAASKFQSGDHYERAQQFLRDSGASSGALPQQMPGMQAGITPQQQAQLSQGMSAYNSAADSQIQSILRLGEAQDAQSALQLRQTIERNNRALEDGLRELSNTARDYERAQEDAAIEVIQGSPVGALISETTQMSRELADKTQEQQLLLRDAQTDLENLRATADYAREFGDLNPALAQALPGIEETIEATEAKIQELEGIVAQEAGIYEARRQRLEEEYRRQQALEREQAQTRTFDLQLQRRAALEGLAGNDTGASLIGTRQSIASTTAGYDEQLRELEVRRNQLSQYLTEAQPEQLNIAGADSLFGGLSDGLALPMEVDTAEVRVAQEELAHLDDQISALEGQREIEIDIALTQARQQFQDFNQGVLDATNNAVLQNIENRGGVFTGARMRQQLATQQEGDRYRLDQRRIDSFEESGYFGADEIARMREEAEALNAVSLANIDAEFLDLGETLDKNVKGSFQSFLGDMDDVIFKGKSLGEAFGAMADQIIDMLFQMAAQWAASELFGGGEGGGLLGGLFGGSGAMASAGAVDKSKGGGGGIGGFFGSIMGGGGGGLGGILDLAGSIFGFAEGGMPENAAPFNGTIAEALKREQQKSGRKAYLATISEGELTLTPKQTERFMDWGGLPMLGFAEGGGVGLDRPEPRYRPKMSESSREKPKKVEVEVTRINEVNYVTAEQFERGMNEAASRGAMEGAKMTMRGLQNSPSSRRSINI